MLANLKYISMINITSESLKARKVFIFQHFSFDEQLEFHAQLIEHEKKVYNLGSLFYSISGAFVIGILMIIRAIYFAAIKTSRRIGPA